MGGKKLINASKPIVVCGENAKEEREVGAWNKVVVGAKSDPSRH